MKFEKNNHYFTIAVYVLLTSLAIVVGTLAIFNFKAVWRALCNIVGLVYWLLKPLIFGLIAAYLLDPIVDFYERRCSQFKPCQKHSKKSNSLKEKSEKKRWHTRTVPTLFTFMTVITILGLFILIIIMNVQEIAGNFSVLEIKASINGYLNYFEQMIQGVNQFIEELGISKGKGTLVQQVYSSLNHFVMNLSANLISFITDFGMNTMNVLLALVIAFYLLQDKEKCLAVSKKISCTLLSPRAYRHSLILSHDINYVFSGYIRGQIIDAFIVAVLTSLALTLIRLDFALIIGVIAGIFNLIPYFGPVVGFVLAIIIGLLDPNPMKAVYGALAILVIQQIDGWIIVPKVVGDSVKLHPVIVLLAILIGGNLFGLVGMLIGVPIAAFIRLALLRYMTELFPDGEESLQEALELQAEEEAKSQGMIKEE